MKSIAFIDIIGIPYDGSTVYNQGLGGSESAVTYMAEELQKIGFSVTVFCNCNIDHATPGIYNDVTYRPLHELAGEHKFDIVVSSRTVIPFTRPEDYPQLGDARAMPFQNMNLYDRILSRAQRRILWMHDTFCLGDNIIEELTVSNRITDIFTLTDWHLTYIANCHHGRRRNFEVLKDHIFLTRNGIRTHIQEVDIRSKKRNLFVYNASVSKGMVPLVNRIWPMVKQQIPEAELIIIGGYYRFSTNDNPDEQELKWQAMVRDPNMAALGITFTGVIPQRQIAEILAQANFMIYPSAFPETFGISTLESLAYNTPVLTCRFGGLEEVAIDEACYKIDYAIEPNGLFPDINHDEQVVKFVQMVVAAYNNTYLHQQKQYYCNIVKEVSGWDTVALQWKQFLFNKLGDYLPIDEYRKVNVINHRVNKIWKRRYHNVVQLENHRINKEQEIVVVTPFWNAANYIEKCIKSVACQDYDNYTHVLIDDCSTDNSLIIAKQAIEKLNPEMRDKFLLIRNNENNGAVKNQITAIRKIVNDNAIVILLDGDDSLINDNSLFSYYNSIYHQDTEFTYGSCWSMVDNIPLISQPYPESVKQSRTYRQHHFNWILPYTHLRTFKKYLINDVPDSMFQDENGNWFKAGGDGSVFYALIEAADPNKVRCLSDIVYNYNDASPFNDYKINSDEQNQTARKIILKNNMPKKKILIAIPTAKYIECETFKSIYDLIIPEGYETTFQCFFGYRIDQVRNLIASWVVNGFDYWFSVDSDISFEPDTLAKMLAHDKDMVSGLYIQRKQNEHILEVYEPNDQGGMANIPYSKIANKGLVEISGCGFGCVLIKSEVVKKIGYPQFEYHVALDHSKTISEDVDFCRKAAVYNYKIYADTTIKCNHHGHQVFTV